MPPDRGHAFENRKYEYQSAPISGTYKEAANVFYRVTNGHLHWFLPSGQSRLHDWTLAPGSVDVSSLVGFAQRAVVDARPSLVEFSLSTFLGEIREGLPTLLPSLLRDKGSIMKSAGKDYLNVQFGWLPFITSLRDIGYSLFRAQTKLNAIQGTPVRRHIKGPSTQAFRQIDGVNFNAQVATLGSTGLFDRMPLPGYTTAGYSVNGIGSGTVLQTLDTSLNFAGSYVTLLPKEFDDTRYLDRLNQLIDPRITPSVLWALSPWSWLVDWLLDIQGTIDANLMAGDETLLVHYAYASLKSSYRQLMWGNPSVNWSGSKLTGVTEGTYYKRIRANPYGFTVGSFGGFSAPQQAILAALGISKGR